MIGFRNCSLSYIKATGDSQYTSLTYEIALSS